MSDHPHTEVFRKWNGKVGEQSNVQYWHWTINEWRTCTGIPSWDIDSRFRIKPEKKLVPFTFEEWLQHKGRWLRHVNGCRHILVHLISSYEDRLCVSGYPTEHLCEKFVFDDTDEPCGKYVEEES